MIQASEEMNSSLEDLIILEKVLTKVDSKQIESTGSIQIAAEGKHSKLSKVKEATGSAPELESGIVVKEKRKLLQANSSDKPLTNSSNSFKPVTRGQIFRRQASKQRNNKVTLSREETPDSKI